jgi:GH24 family phage-related lysozyme (muramidase)
VKRFKDPQNLLLDHPVRGTCKYLPAGTRNCNLSWQVEGGEPRREKAFSVAGATIKVDGNKFEVLVDGKTPAVDMLRCQIGGQGTVRASVQPDFPHAEAVLAAKGVDFQAPLAVEVQVPSNPLFGTVVSFAPKHASVFQGADLELRVLDAKALLTGDGRCAFSHKWGPGEKRRERKWAIGFSDDTWALLGDSVADEHGLFSFTWQLHAANRQGGDAHLILEGRDFLKIKKPRLESFTLVYAPDWQSTWHLSGQVSGVAPEADLMVELAVVEPERPLPPGPLVVAPPDYHKEAKRVTLADDGSFDCVEGEPQPGAPVMAAPLAYGILSLPAAVRFGTPGPIARYLDFDDQKLALWRPYDVTWREDADWVTSQEAPLAKRGQRPKQRGVEAIPAAPAEAGDQRAPLSFDDIWADLSAWEGVIPYMYKDTVGVVTAGAGNALRRVQDATALPFMNRDTGQRASEREVTTAYNEVAAMAKAMIPEKYKKRPAIELENDYIRTLCERRVNGEFLPALYRIFGGQPAFESYPRCARRGLVDMIYILGVDGLPSKFPTLTAAVKARNWSKAAAECHIDTRRETRNDWRISLFRHAATLEPRK